jgi:HPt (histidine-containing phosphotransfer) domain-containing protein
MDAGASNELVLDLDKLRQRFDDDLELLNEIFHVFIAEAPGRRADMEQALAAGDLSGLSRSAHSLKGVAGTMFAEPLRRAAYALEMAAKEGDADRSAPLTAALLDLLETTCGHVRGLI